MIRSNYSDRRRDPLSWGRNRGTAADSLQSISLPLVKQPTSHQSTVAQTGLFRKSSIRMSWAHMDESTSLSLSLSYLRSTSGAWSIHNSLLSMYYPHPWPFLGCIAALTSWLLNYWTVFDLDFGAGLYIDCLTSSAL